MSLTVQRDLASCIPAFRDAKVIDSSAIRLSRAVTHFAPGSYQYLLPAVTSYDNVLMSGDWVVPVTVLGRKKRLMLLV